MSGVLTRFTLIALSVGGVIRRVGSSIRAAREVTITPATYIDMEREFTIAAGGYAVLYDYSETPDFNEFSVEVVSDGGFCEVWYKNDTPTSTSDKTASGSNVRWRQKSISCFERFAFDTQRVRIHPTLATDAGDTGGLPSAMNDAGTLDGYVYKIVVKNPGTSAVTVRRTLIN